MTPLRQRLIEKLRLKNYSVRTQQAYVAAVAHFARHFGRSPDQLGAAEIHQWQLHLRDERQCSWSGYNIAMCGLRFFYREVLEREELIPRLAYMRREKTLPVVPSPEEVRRFLDAVEDDRCRMLLSVAYACGLLSSGSHSAGSVGHRQPADGGPCPARQREEGPLRDPLAGAARDAASLLARVQAPTAALSLAEGSWQASERDHYSEAVSAHLRKGRPGQEAHPTHPPPRLCHASAGERNQHSCRPNVARSSQCEDDRDLHTRLDRGHCSRGQSSGPFTRETALLSGVQGWFRRSRSPRSSAMSDRSSSRIGL